MRRILCISGSIRSQSTNTALLRAIARHSVDLAYFEFAEIGDLPIFSPDLEGEGTPAVVRALASAVRAADGLLFAVPEYAHGIPGGLKNALDWLVSRDEFPDKPVMLVHASVRGAHLRAALAEVLRTMSARLISDDGLTMHLMGKSAGELHTLLSSSESRAQMRRMILAFIQGIDSMRP